MELSRVRPYRFKSLSAIFHLQVSHVKFYMLRTRFTRHQYYSGKVKFAFRFGFWITATYWTITAIMISIFLKATTFFDTFIDNYSQIMKIKNYDTFICTEIVGFVTAEKFWIDNFMQLTRGRHGMVEVAFELGDTFDKELSKEERRMLIRFFTKISFVAGIIYKMSAYGLIPLVMQLNYMSTSEYVSGEISLVQCVLYCWLAIAVNLYASMIMTLMFVFMPHHTFMIKILRIKLTHCMRLMEYASVLENKAFLARFHAEYMQLHRLIQVYNLTMRNQIQVHDTVFKLSGLISFIFYIKQKEKLNHFSYLIITIYCFTYSMYLLVESALGAFPKQNIECYKQMLGLAARTQWKSTVKLRPNKTTRTTNITINSIEFKHSQKIDSLCDFLANNRFGFTYGTRYLITNMTIARTFMTNFYVMALFFKKLKVE